MQAFTLETLARVPAFAAAVRELEAGQLAERQAQIDALAAFRAQWHADLAAVDMHELRPPKPGKPWRITHRGAG